MFELTFQFENDEKPVVISVSPEESVLDAARKANVAIDAPCSGNGSCGKCRVKLVSGGTDNPLNYVVLVVTILAMSAFFSIHYLTVYYLLQPYTAGTEMKSGTYRIVMVLTYVVCYAMINVRMPILMFGAMCIAFCVAYSIVASILVYKFAPRTFRLRT